MVPGREPPRPQGLPLPPRRRPCDSFSPPPRQEKCSAPRRRSRPAPPRPWRGGVRGGVECAPGGEVFCASFRSWQFDVLSPVKSGAARRPEEGAAAARRGEADKAPCAEGVGGMGGVGFESVLGGVRVREPPPTRWKPKRETEEGGGLCAAAPGGRHGHNNRTCPIMSRIMGQAARHRSTEPGPSAQHSGLCLRGLEAPEGGRLPLPSVHRQAISGRKDP